MAKRRRGRKGKAVQQPAADEPEYHIESIVNSRIGKDGGFDYLVKWRDYYASQNSWEPWEAVEDTAAYEAFRNAHLGNAGHHFPPPSAHRDRKSAAQLDAASAEDGVQPSRPRHAFPSNPLIDILSFPHILSLIIQHASPAALAALLPCSKQLFQLAVPHLYRHLRMTTGEIKSLVAKGNLSTSDRSARSLSGRKYSATLREALQQVRMLTHLGCSSDLNELPKGCFEDVEVVVTHSKDGGRFCPPNFISERLPRLVLKVPCQASLAWPQPFIQHFPRSYRYPRDITLIVPDGGSLAEAPSCHIGWPWPDRITFVLLPTAPPDDGSDAWVPSTTKYWRDFPFSLYHWSHIYNIRFVGAEYLGYSKEGVQRRLAQQPPSFGNLSAKSVDFATFEEWLDEQEHGVVFTKDEEVELRRMDRELVAWADRRVATASQGQHPVQA